MVNAENGNEASPITVFECPPVLHCEKNEIFAGMGKIPELYVTIGIAISGADDSANVTIEKGINGTRDRDEDVDDP